MLILVDLTTAELCSGRRHRYVSPRHPGRRTLAPHAAYAPGIARLRAFRTAAERPLTIGALRTLDDHLARIAA